MSLKSGKILTLKNDRQNTTKARISPRSHHQKTITKHPFFLKNP
jgi:hypothetical protein